MQTYDIYVDGDILTTYSSSTQDWDRLCGEVANHLYAMQADWGKAVIARESGHAMGSTYNRR